MTAQKVVPVEVGQVTSVDVQFSIKTASTSIEVTAFAVGVPTDNGDLSTTITQQQLAELPNPGNDMTRTGFFDTDLSIMKNLDILGNRPNSALASNSSICSTIRTSISR